MNEGSQLQRFLQSMPPEYRRVFSAGAVEKHAQVASDRVAGEVRVAVCDVSEGSESVLCVVADDEPGLLSLVCAAFVAHRLDVRAAQIFARRVPDGPDEAVDFFWVRPMKVIGNQQMLTPDQVEAVRATLTQFLRRSEPEDLLDAADQAPASSETPTARPPAYRSAQRETAVYFDLRSLAEGQTVLVLEAPDTERLLLGVTRTLAALRVDILASEVRTLDGWASDRFTLQLDGKPLTKDLCPNVIAAVEESLRRPAQRA